MTAKHKQFVPSDKSRDLKQEVYTFLLNYFDEEYIAEYDDGTPTGAIVINECKMLIKIDTLDNMSDSVLPRNFFASMVKEQESKGNRVFIIHEDEWVSKEPIIQSKLLHNLGLGSDGKIYARDCVVKEVDVSVKNTFLNENHIQGKDNASIKLGLYLNKDYSEDLPKGTLVSIMTFGKPRVSLNSQKNSVEGEFELLRSASRIDLHVVGAFSKLLKHFTSKYEWNKIKTFSDSRYSVSNVYLKNGFLPIRSSNPSYFYFKNGSIVKMHRYMFRKQELPNILSNFDINKTEYENVIADGFSRIWDAGTTVLEMSKETKK
jgi:hypothetical protein